MKNQKRPNHVRYICLFIAAALMLIVAISPDYNALKDFLQYGASICFLAAAIFSFRAWYKEKEKK